MITPKTKSILAKITNDDKFIFYITSIIFTFILFFASMYGDDVAGMRAADSTIFSSWLKTVSHYKVWSSRLFVNFVIFIFTGLKSTFYWAVFMGLSLYVLMYSLSKLFSATSKNQKTFNTIVACMVLLFPYQHLCTAGWIATLATYLSPIAFGFLSLVPIKKIINNQSIKPLEYLLYSASLIYGANNEQMMIVVLGSYCIAILYLIHVKKHSLFIYLQLILSILSCVLILVSPGNYLRKEKEIYTWFPNWGMLNIIDKFDLGYSTTMQWLVFESGAFIIIICLFFSFVIWKKYKNINIFMLSLTPCVFMIFWQFLSNNIFSFFPYLVQLSVPIDKNGLITVVNRGDFMAFIKYFVWAAILIMLCINLFLLQDNIRMLISNFVILFTGFASRVVIGFSPTVHGSGQRTCAVMSFCIIAVSCCIFSSSQENGYLDRLSLKAIDNIAKFLIICSLLNFAALVATT